MKTSTVKIKRKTLVKLLKATFKGGDKTHKKIARKIAWLLK